MARTTKAMLEAEVERLRKLYMDEAAKVRDLSNVDDWQNERTIDGERAFPLFSMTAFFERDWNPDWKHEPASWQTEKMPEGRIKDHSTWGACGFREWPSEGELTKWSRKLWDGTIENPRSESSRIVNPANPSLVVTFRGWAVWWLSWFQHATFDIGLSDEDVLVSFQRHCDREIRKAGHAGKEPCLMGAEDRWRWTGEPGDGHEDRSSPPCRCQHCKDAGLVRIGH